MLTFSLPKIPWHVQVLTLDYLVDGYIEGSHDKAYFRAMANVLFNIALANARFQATGSLQVPGREAAPWTLVYGEQLVALIPWDKDSFNAAMQANGDYKIATPGEVYVGNYLIRGTVLSYNANLNVMATQHSFPVQNAEITCRLPGSTWPGLKAPYVMVTSQHKQLIIADF